jgi:predicted N-acetyltransferase YhbS
MDSPNQLPNGYLLKSAQTDEDIERLAQFNKLIHTGEDIENLVRMLGTEHPFAKKSHWLFIEEASSQRIISSVALIPWRINFAGVKLEAAELGFVGTLPEFRKQGLIRTLMKVFHEIVESEGFVFSFLQGIPYYYRQFGYEYAIPLEVHINLELNSIAQSKTAGRDSLSVRNAKTEDIPRLKELYDSYCSSLSISTERSPGVWNYLFGPSLKTELIHDTYCVENGKRKIVAYFRIAHHGFGEGLIIDEASRVSRAIAGKIIFFSKQLAIARQKSFLRFNLAPAHSLVRYARSLGAEEKQVYAWQVRFGDIRRFIKAIEPVLEQRVQGSDLSGLTGRVLLNLYREAWALVFRKGTLEKIEPLGTIGETSSMLPPFAAIQLFLGHRSILELQKIYPDVWVRGEEWKVLDVLFPKLDSFLHTNY